MLTSDDRTGASVFPRRIWDLSGLTAVTFSSPISRNEFLAAVCLFTFINGLWSRTIHSTLRSGWIDGALRTFDTSVIVWLACFLGVSLVLREKSDQVKHLDFGVGILAIALASLPIGGLSWFALSLICVYILAISGRGSARARGAIILLAATVPMLWSLMLYQFFANLILNIDASLISWLLGTDRSGNMVQFLQGPDYLVILPACSSLANTSLAFLCWIVLSQSVGHRWSPRDLLWCALSCISVISLNVLRMSLMGVGYGFYELIHGPLGNGVSNLLITGVALTICLIGLRREVFSN